MNIAAQLPLAAPDIFEVIQGIVVIILMIAGAASHLFTAKPKPKPPARPRPVNPPPNAGAPGGAAGIGGAGGQAKPPMSLEETLRREVEEFMRRAQGREPAPQQRSKPQKPGPQRQPQRPTKQPAADQPVRRLADTSRPAIAPAAQPVQPPRSTTLGAGVGQHVAQHLTGGAEIAAHVQHLGADVAQADERLAAHLQAKFTHQVGNLQHQDTGEQRKVVRPPVAQSLVDLLRQPGGARQAVLLSEIFRRPEERW
jgi:hypothetical protein